MNESKRAKNCERCKTRAMADKYLGRVFDYRDCPFVCVQNGMYEKLYSKTKQVRRGIIYGR